LKTKFKDQDRTWLFEEAALHTIIYE
jgi:hypothetical protein